MNAWLSGRFAGQVSEQMVTACNAVRKLGMNGYLTVSIDPTDGQDWVFMVKRVKGRLQHVRMPAVDNLVLMTKDEPQEIMHFLARETSVAYRACVNDDADAAF